MKEVIRKILLVIFLGIFLYAAYNLATIGFKYYKVDKDTKAVKETYVKQIDDSNDPLKRKIDFTALKQKNADVVGWLYIPGTKIDEVVLKGANNDTYLHHNIDKQYSFAGELFVENVNNANFKDVQTV
ncbi:MAG TPA: SrtB family sortase, partial [Erysipelotrichaceae bacterium]|nr:SrtB family sortase [Erysipelotrichaceae bacterium]